MEDEEIVNENGEVVRKEASQKAMKAMVGLVAVLSVAAVAGVIVIATLLQRL